MANQQSGSGQGAVKHPENDKRLKENQDGDRADKKGHDDDDDASMSKRNQNGAQSSEPERDEDGKFTSSGGSGSRESGRGQSSSSTPGTVTDPEHDGRLKQNRDQGIKKSDKA